MKSFTKLLIIFIALFSQSTSFSKSSDSDFVLFTQGNSAFQNGDYTAAKKYYEDLLTKGYDSADLYYNLGTTEQKLENTYKAYAYLTKAYKLNPRDREISHNLQKLIEDYNLPDPGMSGFNSLITSLPFDNWLLLFISAITLTSLPVALRIAGVKTNLILWGIIIGGGVSILILIPLGISFYDTYINKSAIIVETTPVLSGPGSRFQNHAEITPGNIIKLKPFSENGYQQIILPDGKQGYVHNSTFVEL